MKKDSAIPQDNRKQLGQSLVEMAFAMTILIILLAGLVDMGRAWYIFTGIQDAAGEGAAYGLIKPTWHDNSDNADPNNITYRALNEAKGNQINWDAATVTVDAPFPTPGNLITVTVAYEFGLIMPISQLLAGRKTLTITAKAIQIIVSPA